MSLQRGRGMKGRQHGVGGIIAAWEGRHSGVESLVLCPYLCFSFVFVEVLFFGWWCHRDC